MNLTDKEIKLAKQLKKEGLSWNPQGGDWYVDRDGDVELLTGMSSDMWNQCESLPIENKIWLPEWQQCRQILADNDLYILLLTKKDDDIQLDVWKHDGGHKTLRGKYIGMVCGNTDLEVMYQAIWLYVLKGD